MPKAPYIPIQDEIKTIVKLLRDEERNFRLNEIVYVGDSVIPGGDKEDRDQGINQRGIKHFGELPRIEIDISSISSFEFSDPFRENFLVDRLLLRIRLDIHIASNGSIVYDGVTYSNSPASLRVITEVILTTFAHAPRYDDPENGVCWTDFTFDGLAILPQNKRGDIDTMRLFFSFNIEKTRPYISTIPR